MANGNGIARIERLITIGGVIVALVGGWFTMQANVSHAKETAVRAEEKADSAVLLLHSIDVRLSRIEEGVKHIQAELLKGD